MRIHWKRYLLFALILSGIIAYCAWGFGEPEREKDRYVRKSEIVAVFRQNYADFAALAKGMPPDADWYHFMHLRRPVRSYARRDGDAFKPV